MAGKRIEDPNAMVQVVVKIPNWLRDKFAAVALLKGDIRPGKRLEKLIRMDIESVIPGELGNRTVVREVEEFVSPEDEVLISNNESTF